MTITAGNFVKLGRLLRSPWAILLGMAGGITLGITDRGLAMQVAPMGDLYMNLLTMCVLPIMGTAVVSSLGRLLSSSESARYLKRIGVVFTCGIILATAVGLGVALIGKPGAGLNQETRGNIGRILMQAEANSALSSPIATGLAEFLQMVIPTNIFGALSQGKNLQILFFSLVFGLAIGLIPSDNREQFLDLTEVAFNAFVKVIGMAMYVLPFGLFSMIAGQVATGGVGVLMAMGRYVVMVHVAFFILMIAGGLVISWAARKSFLQAFSELREPLVVAFGTRSSYAALPSMLEALRENFRMPPEIVNLVVPLSVVVCRYSMLLVFTIGAVFVAELYNIPVGAPQIGIIFGGAMLGMLAGAGAPGVVALAMISMVLIPLGLPVNAAVIMLLAVNFLIDPALTILNVYLTCGAVVVVGRERC
jgi:proton glutamate symport protein